MNTIRVAIVDDHDLFREGIRLVLGQIDGLEVVFHTSDGYRFVEILDDIPVDLALMDIEMPVLNGAQTTIKALQAKPGLNIIALSMFSDTGHYTQMIQAGVKGFILKKASKYELQEAIETVYHGGSYFSKDILKRINCQSINQPGLSDGLTNREMDIMKLICQGYTTQEISDSLSISSKTVETHRGRLLLKSDVRNSAGLVVWAIKNHYFTIE